MKKSIRIAALVAAATLAAGALVAPTANAASKVKAAVATTSVDVATSHSMTQLQPVSIAQRRSLV